MFKETEEVAMKKILMVSLSVLVAVALAMPAIAARPAAPEGPMKMALTEKSVTFNHTSHASIDCGVCHHEVNGAENFGKCSAAGCHDALGAKEKGKNSYYRIAHDKKIENSCISCHTKAAGQDKDKKKTLTSCKGSACHP